MKRYGVRPSVRLSASLSVCLSHSLAAATCGGFVAVDVRPQYFVTCQTFRQVFSSGLKCCWFLFRCRFCLDFRSSFSPPTKIRYRYRRRTGRAHLSSRWWYRRSRQYSWSCWPGWKPLRTSKASAKLSNTQTTQTHPANWVSKHSGSPLVSIPELTCHMESHSVTCHSAEVTLWHRTQWYSIKNRKIKNIARWITPALTPAEAGTGFSDPKEMQDRVDLDTVAKRSPYPRLHITLAIAINTTVRGEIQTPLGGRVTWAYRTSRLQTVHFL